MRVIKSCQSDLARDRPKRKVLAKVVLQQPGRVPVTTGLAPPADIFTLHFIQAFRHSGIRTVILSRALLSSRNLISYSPPQMIGGNTRKAGLYFLILLLVRIASN